MLIQQLAQRSIQRLAVQQSGAFSKAALCRFAAPATIATSNNRIQSRHAATQNVKQAEAYEILVKQRLNRPVSPHLSIYQPQVTWYLSGLNRLTGVIVSGGFYIFGITYLASPLLGWHIESANLAAAFGSLPVAAKMALKFGVALPFTFHSWNGFRHLIWDTGREFGNKQVQRSGWFVVGLTVVSSGVLAYI